MSRSKDGKTDELRNMLITFRIAELQTLLSSCGRSRSGRKHELLGRAVSLLKASEGSPMRDRVRSRILELYHQRYLVTTNNSSGGGNNISQNSYSSQPYMSSHVEKEEELAYVNRSNQYNNLKHVSHRSTPSNYAAHDSIHRPHHNIYEPPRNIHSTVEGVPVHPDVRFIGLPFYEIVDVLNKATSLAQKTVSGYQETHLSCSLSPYQTQLITNSRSYNLKNILEYAVQVHIRFCLAETSCAQEDLYPPRCKIIVNGKSCPLPGQPPPNAQNQEPRKPHRPINITQLCRLSPMQSNQITIQWMPSDLGQRHAVTIHLVKTVQVTTLIKKLEERPTRSADHTIAFIKEKLKQDPDSEIALTSLKVSLSCPISRTKMKIPCRANNCNHLQCFDGETYIKLNERKPSWVCPVCDQKAHYDQIFKDGLFINIIEKSPDSDEIIFFEDGSWRPLSDVQDSSKPLSQVVTPNPKIRTSVVDCKTPPTLLVNTPPPPKIEKNANSPPRPNLEKAPSISNEQPTNIEPANQEEVEIITIQDSDSDDNDDDEDDDDDDDDIPVNPIPSMAHSTSSRRGYGYPSGPLGGSHSSSLPFSDPDLQGLDLYNLLPHEDRIAAAMYLDQAGILGQLTNGHGSRSVPSIIDISDE